MAIGAQHHPAGDYDIPLNEHAVIIELKQLLADIISSWRFMKGGAVFRLLIHMNLLPSQLPNGLLLQYADDTTIVYSGIIPAAVQTIVCFQLSLLQQ